MLSSDHRAKDHVATMTLPLQTDLGEFGAGPSVLIRQLHTSLCSWGSFLVREVRVSLMYKGNPLENTVGCGGYKGQEVPCHTQLGQCMHMQVARVYSDNLSPFSTIAQSVKMESI